VAVVVAFVVSSWLNPATPTETPASAGTAAAAPASPPGPVRSDAAVATEG